MSLNPSSDEHVHGLARSSSSSSASSTSSTSSSSTRHRRHPSHRRRPKSRSSYRSSSDSSRSRSPTRSRSRSPTGSQSRSSDQNHPKVNPRRDKDDSGQGAEAVNKTETSGVPSSDRRDVDDSIRSDQSSKPSANGGQSDAATSSQPTQKVGDKRPAVAKPPMSSRLAGIQFGKPGTVFRPGIQMKLAQPKPPSEQTRKITVASAFNNDSDDEAEEMPPECKMRMRNIGRDTPTSSGPNSFGKTKQGFIDSKKLFEKSLRETALD